MCNTVNLVDAIKLTRSLLLRIKLRCVGGTALNQVSKCLIPEMFLLDIVVIAIFSIVARKTDADDTWDGGRSYRECEMCSRVGWGLEALAVQILEAKSLSVCSLLCLNSAECSCVNYLPGARSCELLAAAECQSYGVSLVEDPTTVFYTRELCNNLQSDPCKSSH